MANIMLNDFIADQDLSKHREKYNSIKLPSEDDQFQFALNLIRSKHSHFVTEGLSLFKILFTRTKDEDIKRDSLYYMAIAETKLNNYEQALRYCKTILNIQPTNDQVRELYGEIENRMKRDGLIGVGIVGGAALVGVFGLLGLGAALVAKKK